jgi:hypothetical protein
LASDENTIVLLSVAQKIREAINDFYSGISGRRPAVDAAFDRLTELSSCKSPKRKMSKFRESLLNRAESPEGGGGGLLPSLSNPEEGDGESSTNNSRRDRPPTMRMALSALVQSSKMSAMSSKDTGRSTGLAVAASMSPDASPGPLSPGSSKNRVPSLKAFNPDFAEEFSRKLSHLNPLMTGNTGKSSNIPAADPRLESEIAAFKQLKLVEACLGHLWLYCRQICCLLKYFKDATNFGLVQRYGTFAVEMLVFLHPRIVDLYNIDVVLSMLSAEDVAAFICRVGWLNVFNPMKPNGYYVLNVGVSEERAVTKMLFTIDRVDNGTYESELLLCC